MRKSKTDYQRKCKMKTVTFYTNKEEQELYEFANTLNFQKFVKDCLRIEFEKCKICIIEEGFGTLENYNDFMKAVDHGTIQDK